jgi:hypothetical protein
MNKNAMAINAVAVLIVSVLFVVIVIILLLMTAPPVKLNQEVFFCSSSAFFRGRVFTSLDITWMADYFAYGVGIHNLLPLMCDTQRVRFDGSNFTDFKDMETEFYKTIGDQLLICDYMMNHGDPLWPGGYGKDPQICSTITFDLGDHRFKIDYGDVLSNLTFTPYEEIGETYVDRLKGRLLIATKKGIICGVNKLEDDMTKCNLEEDASIDPEFTKGTLYITFLDIPGERWFFREAGLRNCGLLDFGKWDFFNDKEWQDSFFDADTTMICLSHEGVDDIVFTFSGLTFKSNPSDLEYPENNCFVGGLAGKYPADCIEKTTPGYNNLYYINDNDEILFYLQPTGSNTMSVCIKDLPQDYRSPSSSCTIVGGDFYALSSGKTYIYKGVKITTSSDDKKIYFEWVSG